MARLLAAPPTGRENVLGMLSQDGASLCPGLFSFLPSGKTASFYTAATTPLGIAPSGAKAQIVLCLFAARLKPCPDTKPRRSGPGRPRDLRRLSGG
jgi:hypothetical protein